MGKTLDIQITLRISNETHAQAIKIAQKMSVPGFEIDKTSVFRSAMEIGLPQMDKYGQPSFSKSVEERKETEYTRRTKMQREESYQTSIEGNIETLGNMLQRAEEIMWGERCHAADLEIYQQAIGIYEEMQNGLLDRSKSITTYYVSLRTVIVQLAEVLSNVDANGMRLESTRPTYG